MASIISLADLVIIFVLYMSLFPFLSLRSNGFLNSYVRVMKWIDDIKYTIIEYILLKFTDTDLD